MGKDNQEHHFYSDGRRCSLRGNCFRPPVVSECSGHNLPAPFLQQDTTLPQRSGLRVCYSATGFNSGVCGFIAAKPAK